jgi:hypothetical protein
MEHLHLWLQEKAGLSGAKMAAAMKACEDEMISSVLELLELSETSEQFKEALPQAMIRSRIIAALEKSKAGIQASEPPKSNAASPKASTGKRYDCELR